MKEKLHLLESNQIHITTTSDKILVFRWVLRFTVSPLRLLETPTLPCPDDGRLLTVLTPDSRRPIPDGEEVLDEGRIALQRVHRSVMRLVDSAKFLLWRLALAVTGDNNPVLCPYL